MKLFTKIKYISCTILAGLVLCAGLLVMTGCGEPEYVSLTYLSDETGYVTGQAEQRVEKGRNGKEVTAVPLYGFEFVSWDDGVETAARTDKNVTEDKVVTATFAPKDMRATYEAGEGGCIMGEAEQKVKYNETCTIIYAEPDEGYEFVEWSDGNPDRYRRDKLTEDIHVTAYFRVKEYRAVYNGGSGSIEGAAEQTVKHGEMTTPVTVIPAEHRVFVKWSDGVTSITRQDVITRPFEVTALYEIEKFDVIFKIQEGGRLDGQAHQKVAYESKNATVEAIPLPGYEFLGWSDGTTTPRWQFTITENLEVTALFRRIEYKVKYSSNAGGRLEGPTEHALYYMQNAAAVTAVPDAGYEFISWSDGIETATRHDRGVKRNIDVLATFAPIGQTEYRVLMVIVPEIRAELKTKKGEVIPVKTTMTEDELEFNRWLPKKFAAALNAIFAGKVKFVVDSYFTKEPVGTESFSGYDGDKELYASNISEIIKSKILLQYRSVLTTFLMRDYDNVLHYVGGRAGQKYGYLHMENLGGYVQQGVVGELLDFSEARTHEVWENHLNLYIHEFIHTAENQIVNDVYEYHKAVAEYVAEYREQFGIEPNYFKMNARYLLNKMELKEEGAVGIPAWYWTGEGMQVEILYWAGPQGVAIGGLLTGGGEIINQGWSIKQKVPYGGDAEEVEAVPKEGYRFVKWSDGLTTAKRQDKNISSYLLVYAIFEKIE